MRNFLILLVATTTLSACQQGNPYGYGQNEHTYQGAAIGAVIGGAAGALASSKNRGDHAAIGAAVGALGGGAYGQYMDRQEAAMRQATQGTGIDVVRQGDDLLLNMPSSITFATNSHAIQPALRPTLDNIGSVLQSYPETIVEIIGHTDDTGAEEYNMTLSDQRASAVADYLRNHGVSQRMMTTGLGETQPIASNASEQGRAQNRRVEVKISPIAR